MNAGEFVKQCVAKASKQPTVRFGSSGVAVATWQKILGALTKQSFPIRGSFDEVTRAATIAFQRKVGLPADGVVGTKTWTAAAVAPCYAEAVARAKSAAPRGPSGSKLANQRALRGLGGGHGGGGHGGGGHHGGGRRGGRGWGGGGAYFAPGGGYPYLLDDVGPTLLVVDDCPSRVRSSCYQQFSQDPAKQAGCAQAGLARCGTSGLGDMSLTFSVLDGKSVVLGAVLGLVAGAVLFSRK